MEMSNNGINMLKGFEGCRLAAYQDSVGVWTIGYGWTQPVNGVPVGKGMTITQETADSLLRSGLVQYEKGVTGLVKVTINQNQFDALVSLTYNIGTNAFKNSTLVKKLNAGDYRGAADQFDVWVNAGGKRMQGLANRRTKEKEVFLR